MRIPALALLTAAFTTSIARTDVLTLDDGTRVIKGELLEQRRDGFLFRAEIGGVWTSQLFTHERVQRIRCEPGNQCDLDLPEDAPGMRPDADGNPAKPKPKGASGGGATAPRGATPAAGAGAKSPSNPSRGGTKQRWSVGATPPPVIDRAKISASKTSVVAALEVARASRQAIDDALAMIAEEQKELQRAAAKPDGDDPKARERQVELFFEPDRLKQLIPASDETVKSLERVVAVVEASKNSIAEADRTHKARQLAESRLALTQAYDAYEGINATWTTERQALLVAWTELDARVIADETVAAASDLDRIYESLEKAIARKSVEQTVADLTRLGNKWTPRAVAEAMRAKSEQWSTIFPSARTVADPTGAPLSAERHTKLYEAMQALTGLDSRIRNVNASWCKTTGLDQIILALEASRLSYAEKICTQATDRLETSIGNTEMILKRPNSAAALAAEQVLLRRALQPEISTTEWRFALARDRERAKTIIGRALDALWARTERNSFEAIETVKRSGEQEAARTGKQFPAVGPLGTAADGGTICGEFIKAFIREMDQGMASVSAAAESNIPEWGELATLAKKRFETSRTRAVGYAQDLTAMQREYDIHAPDIDAIQKLDSDDNDDRAEGLAAFIKRHFNVTIDRVGFLTIAGADLPGVQFRIKGKHYRCILRFGNNVIFTEVLDPIGRWVFLNEVFFDKALAEARVAVGRIMSSDRPFVDGEHVWKYCRALHEIAVRK